MGTVCSQPVDEECLSVDSTRYTFGVVSGMLPGCEPYSCMNHRMNVTDNMAQDDLALVSGISSLHV
jgi:hypothetical protein